MKQTRKKFWRRGMELTETASPCTVMVKSVLSSGSFATSNEHLGLAKRSCTKDRGSNIYSIN